MNEAQERENSTGGRLSAPAPDLAGMSDDELLRMRICDLKLKISGSELETRIEKFYAELERNMLHAHALRVRHPRTLLRLSNGEHMVIVRHIGAEKKHAAVVLADLRET